MPVLTPISGQSLELAARTPCRRRVTVVLRRLPTSPAETPNCPSVRRWSSVVELLVPTAAWHPRHWSPPSKPSTASEIRIHGLHAHRRSSDVRAVGSVLPAFHGLHVHRLCGDVRAVGCTTRAPRPDIEGNSAVSEALMPLRRYARPGANHRVVTTAAGGLTSRTSSPRALPRRRLAILLGSRWADRQILAR